MLGYAAKYDNGPIEAESRQMIRTAPLFSCCNT